MDIDYKKLYNETLQKLYEMVSKGIITEEVAKGICADFAVESEDEKIRQFFIHEVEGTSEEIMSYRGMNKESVLAWLKKQGEQKPYGQREECVDCQFNYAGECKGSCAMKRGEQKPVWSEEDEDILNTIINHFKVDIECIDEDDTVRWLKSVKDRILSQSKPEQNK